MFGRKHKIADGDMVRLGALAAHAHAACTPVRKTRKVPRTAKQRRKIPGSLFAIPDARKFPINDAYHAKLALTHLARMVGRHGLHAEYKSEARKVIAAVRKHWPSVAACEADLITKLKKEFKI